MPANSLPRRVLKRLLAPVMGQGAYRLVQCLAMSWDIRSGAWHEPELELLPYAVRPGDTVLDIGANYGLYSYHLSKRVGPAGRVYAFEPVPFTSATFRLVQRLLRVRSVVLIEKGCSDRTGRIPFTVPLQESGAIIAGLVHARTRDNDRQGKDQHARFQRTKDLFCDVVAVDEYLPDLLQVSFIKCDIEGADLFALRGARRTIERNLPVVVCEINPWFLEGFGLKVQDLTDFFFGMGYLLYRYEQGRLIATPPGAVVEDNWVFVHPARHDRMAPLLPAAPAPSGRDRPAEMTT